MTKSKRGYPYDIIFILFLGAAGFLAYGAWRMAIVHESAISYTQYGINAVLVGAALIQNLGRTWGFDSVSRGHARGSVGFNAVRRGRQRVDRIEIRDAESDQVVGALLGILPGSKRFEMKLLGSRVLIKGYVAATLAPDYLVSIETPGETPVVGKAWRTKNANPRNHRTQQGAATTLHFDRFAGRNPAPASAKATRLRSPGFPDTE